MKDGSNKFSLDFYVLGHKINPQECSDGTLGYIWGNCREGSISIPAMVCYDENWGKFLLASENEETMNPHLYNVISKGNNDELRLSLLPREFYFMAEPEDRDDDWRIGDLANAQFHSSDQLDDTEVEIADEDDFVIPSLVAADNRFSQIDEERQAEIISRVITDVGSAKERGATSVFSTLQSKLEADLACHIWPHSKRITDYTVQFLTEKNDSETTAISVINKTAASSTATGHRYQYYKQETTPFPEILAIDGEPAPPCHKTFLSNFK